MRMDCILLRFFFFFFKQKTAYEMRISDWSSDVCSSDLARGPRLSGLFLEVGVALADAERRIGFARQRFGCTLRKGPAGRAASVLVEDPGETAALLGEDIVHVRCAEAGAVVAAHQQAIDRAPFEAGLPGRSPVHRGDVVVKVVQ